MKMTSAQAARMGLIEPPPGSHDAIVRTFPDWLLEAVIGDLGRRNLRDYRNHETRWLGERASAARAERRRRKGGRP